MKGVSFTLIKEMYDYFSRFDGFKKSDYVFPAMQARCKYDLDVPIGDHTPTRWIKDLSEYNGIKNITFHGLRHSCVCYLVCECNLTLAEVADYIGDTMDVVSKHYYEFFNSGKIKMADTIANHEDRNIDKIMKMNRVNR